MKSVTISTKFQITLSKQAREQLGIRPGDKLQVLVYDGRIQLIPLIPIEKAQGIFEGIDSNFLRESENA